MTKYGNFTSSFEFDQTQETTKNVIYGGKERKMLFEEKQFLHLFYAFVLSISFFIVTYTIRSKIITTTTYDSNLNKEKIDDTQMMLVCIYYLIMAFVALYCVHYFFAEPFENSIPWHLFIVVVTWSACTLYDLNMAFSFLQNAVQENHQVLLELEKNQQMTEQFQQQYQHVQQETNDNVEEQQDPEQFNTTLDQVHLPENIVKNYSNYHIQSDQYSIPSSTPLHHNQNEIDKEQYSFHENNHHHNVSNTLNTNGTYGAYGGGNMYNDFYSEKGIESLSI